MAWIVNKKRPRAKRILGGIVDFIIEILFD